MLNTIVIEGDKNDKNKNNLTPVKFQTHHIIEIFMHFLPKIDLDGSTKLTIRFAKRPSDEEIYHCSKSFKVSWYYVEPEKIPKEKIDNNRDLFYLELIGNVLKEIAQINQCDTSVLQKIEEAMYKVREQKFTLMLPIKKLSKTSMDKVYKASVVRILCPQGEKWQVKVSKCDEVIGQADLSMNYKYVSQENLYAKMEWQDDRFLIYDRLRRVVVAVIPAEKVLQRYSFNGKYNVEELKK